MFKGKRKESVPIPGPKMLAYSLLVWTTTWLRLRAVVFTLDLAGLFRYGRDGRACQRSFLCISCQSTNGSVAYGCQCMGDHRLAKL